MARSATWMLITLARVVDLAQRKQHLRGIVGVGIELVVELEVPAAGFGLRHFDGPVARVADFLGEHPVGSLEHARIVARYAGFAECVDSLRRIPHRGDARRHAEGRLGHLRRRRLFDAELFKFVAGADHLRIVFGVAKAAQCDDRVEHRRIDGAETVGHLKTIKHPLLRAFQSESAQGANVDGFGKVKQPVDDEKEVAPGDESLAIHAQTEDRVGPAANKKLVDSLLRRNLLERLFGVDDRQRYENRTRPCGDLVDVEVEPVGKENDLRRDGRNGIIVVLAERAEIHLSEGIALDHAAVGENPLAAFHHAWIVGTDAHELCREVAFHGEREIAGAAGVDGPTAVLVLIAPDLGHGPLQTTGVTRLEQRVKEDVVGLEHRICFEFTAPVAVRVLLGEKVFARAEDGLFDVCQVLIDAAEPWNRGM